MTRPNKLEDVERFILPEPNTGCWIWTGALDGTGYGFFKLHGKLIRAYNAVWQYFKGTILSGLELDHLCKNRWCVNPRHLEPVTHQENIARGRNYYRNLTHCKNGHEFTKENTQLRGPIKNWRACKTCKRDNLRRYRARTISI